MSLPVRPRAARTPHADGPAGWGDYLPAPDRGAPRTHLLAFAIEDLVQQMDHLVAPAHWHRFERRMEVGTRRVLDALDAHGQIATFFTLGWVADTMPELVAEVARRGHEVASRGYAWCPLRRHSRDEIRDDLARGREAIERATGARVLGYRAPGWLGADDEWLLAALADEGYAYDSSVKPRFVRRGGAPWHQHPYPIDFDGRTLWEVPVTALRLAGVHLPIGAGNYSRQLPRWMMRRVLDGWQARHRGPFALYFHVWEFDAEQPRISAVQGMEHVRLYRNMSRMPALLEDYLGRYRFTSVADHLGLAAAAAAPQPARAPRLARDLVRAGTIARPAVVRAAGAPDAVTVVVPCYNEELALPYLANTLAELADELAPAYALSFVFVDDASTDRTAETLARLFGGRDDCTVVRHEVNRGVARAILTGARAARTAVVASIDCDCTYDPQELRRLIPMLAAGVDVVTGSPYHPAGAVRNVPRWRLALSRSASALYRVVLRQKISTYTSCFRVYRRDALLGITVRHGGFLGVAEMLGRLDLAGRTIVECPTTLHVRVLGHSKMKVVRTVAGHVRLLAELAVLRLRTRGAAPAPLAAPEQAPTRAGA